MTLPLMNVLGFFAVAVTVLLLPSGKTNNKTAPANDQAYRKICDATGKSAIKESISSYASADRAAHQEDNQAIKEPKILGLSRDAFAQALVALLLAVITGVYVVITGRMFGRVSAQVDIMRQQVDNSVQQLTTAKISVFALHRQADEMRRANEQTNRLIEQSKASAEAAKDSADAAGKSAVAFVRSERAWLYPELTVRDPAKFAYNLVVTNFGRTLGHIESVHLGFSCIAPHQRPKGPFEYGLNFPDENILILPTQPIIVKDFKINDYFYEQWNDIIVGTKQAIVFASVVYRDMVDERHESFLCYGYRIPSAQLEEWRACRKYT